MVQLQRNTEGRAGMCMSNHYPSNYPVILMSLESDGMGWDEG